MARVIHTGDTHLGYRQYHRTERKRDFRDAFEQVADDAVADDVDAVVHAGDLFHDRRPELGDVMGALSVLRTLDDADVPFLAVVGNHEAKRSGQWLDLFESLGLATRLGDEPVVVGNTAFYGLDFVPRSQREGFDPAFEPLDGDDAASVDHAALVTHGLFDPFDFGEWDPREIIEPASVDFDAMLLGDNHDPATAEVEGTWVTYCGSTERASAAERDDRGYNLVSFDGDVDVRRRGLDTREFVFVEVDLGDGEGADRVRERVGQYDLDDRVVIVGIEGDGDPLAPATVEEYALDRGALVARVTDHREFPEEAEHEVSFADPDEAVRERVRELGLSDAARDVDETVRASKVADSNVDEEVESRVAELVEDGDPSAFEAADPAAPEGPDEPGESGKVDESGESGKVDESGESGQVDEVDGPDESSEIDEPDDAEESDESPTARPDATTSDDADSESSTGDDAATVEGTLEDFT